MANKTNMRSFRYSDEVAAILAQQQGKSENDKFEQLVLTCYYRLPQVEKSIGEAQARLMKLLAQCRIAEQLYSDLRGAAAELESCTRLVERFSGRLEAITERVEKL